MDYQQPPQLYHMPPPPPPPAPPSMADPHNQIPPPVQPPNPWGSNQFHYHQSQPLPPPPQPPPPHQHQQWPPHPPSYPGPPHAIYPQHHVQHGQYPQSLPPPPRPNIPPPVPHANQDWGNMSWGHHQSWEYTAHSGEEDWAAKARAWAAAKDPDNQQQQSHLTHDSRLEGQSHYYDQYPRSLDQNFQEMQRPPVPPSSHQHHMASVAPPQRTPLGHTQGPAFFFSGQPSNVPDMQPSRDGNFTGDSIASFPQHGNSSMSPLVHQQEVMKRLGIKVQSSMVVRLCLATLLNRIMHN